MIEQVLFIATHGLAPLPKPSEKKKAKRATTFANFGPKLPKEPLYKNKLINKS